MNSFPSNTSMSLWLNNWWLQSNQTDSSRALAQVQRIVTFRTSMGQKGAAADGELQEGCAPMGNRKPQKNGCRDQRGFAEVTDERKVCLEVSSC